MLFVHEDRFSLLPRIYLELVVCVDDVRAQAVGDGGLEAADGAPRPPLANLVRHGVDLFEHDQKVWS